MYALIFLASALLVAAKPGCRCTPEDNCWPTTAEWTALNSSVGGQLIATQPLAISCYPGPAQNAQQCALVDSQWSNASFQSDSPVGLSYPINITCPPVNATIEKPGSCSIGTAPRYAVNVTSVQQIATAITFAKSKNVRLVIKDTGHDILGRSDGYGSLEVWIRHLRTGVTYQPTYKSCNNYWNGPAFKIGGGYTWEDVYPLAQEQNVVVVGGGTPSVGCLGGWMQGGGHGPASRQFGLGADQVLEAQVVLADGSIITANACQNADIFFAIRGGGPGTYGVVTSTTIKAHPMVNVTVQHLALAPLGNTTAMLDAISILYSSYPNLNDAGYAGYGTWSVASPTPLFANFTSGYVHGFYMFDQSESAAVSAFAPVLAKLLPYNMTSLFISVSYVSYPDYWSFYTHESGVEPPVGTSAALGSRLFSRQSVSNATTLRQMIGVIAGTATEFTSNNFELVSGGQVFKDANEVPVSGLNPAWRFSYFNNIVARGWAPGSDQATINGVYNDIAAKVDAMENVAPNTGVYMNEADRLDPNWKVDFYGSHYNPLLSIKQKRDPNGTFYCPTCVGSDAYAEDSTGRLCKVAEFGDRRVHRRLCPVKDVLASHYIGITA